MPFEQKKARAIALMDSKKMWRSNYSMIKIISDMILCVLLNYHIICPFPVVQIRFPAVTDLPPPPHSATPCKHNM